MLSHSGKVKQTMPTFLGYGLARYKKCKSDIAIPKERGQAKCKKDKRYKERRL